MGLKIIADSCCDTTAALRDQLELDLVPLIIKIPGYGEILDEVGVDTGVLVEKMSQTKEPARTACPSIDDYANRMAQHDESVVITLSQHLSGSNNAAHVARNLVLQQHPEKKIHIFDSQSAAAGELLIAMFIDRLKKLGETFEDIVVKTEAFIKSFRTLFVLEDVGNLVKNGRMSKVKGIVASVLSIHPVLADNGEGEIQSMSIVRGLTQALAKLVSLIGSLTEAKPAQSTPLVLSHCHCEARALTVKEQILLRCPAISDIVVVPTSGLSTIYANKGGIIVAF